MGSGHFRCYRGVSLSSLSCADTNSDQVHQNRTIRDWLHREEYGARWKGGKTQSISGVRHRIRALPFDSHYLSPSGQGVYPTCFLVALSHSYGLGYHCVYGWGARRRDIPHRRPYRYSAVQLNVLRGSGMYMARTHTMNITTDVSNRDTCFFSSETLAWRVVTLTMQFNCSSVRKTTANT